MVYIRFIRNIRIYYTYGLYGVYIFLYVYIRRTNGNPTYGPGQPTNSCVTHLGAIPGMRHAVNARHQLRNGMTSSALHQQLKIKNATPHIAHLSGGASTLSPRLTEPTACGVLLSWLSKVLERRPSCSGESHLKQTEIKPNVALAAVCLLLCTYNVCAMHR